MLRNLILALLICFGVSAAQAGPTSAFEGRKLYQSYCLLCHGADGGGDGPLARSMEIPAADLAGRVGSRSDAELGKIITGGGTPAAGAGDRHELLSAAMPEWKYVFDPSQVDALIAYLRFLARNKHDLPGDPEAGAGLYQRYCRACHGEVGDGSGTMVKLLGIAPMDHTAADVTDPLDNARLMASILDGKGRFMPAWRGILSQSEAEALVSYIRLLAN